MNKTLNNILNVKGEIALCEIIYHHDNGDIFRDYEEVNIKDIREKYSKDDIRLINEHLDALELEELINTIYKRG